MDATLEYATCLSPDPHELPRGTGGDPRYVTCGTNCTVAANLDDVEVQLGGDVGLTSSLGVDATGRVPISHYHAMHVSYVDQTLSNLRYATCATKCALAGSWRATAAADGGGTSSLAVDDAGDVHVAYSILSAGELRYIR